MEANPSALASDNDYVATPAKIGPMPRYRYPSAYLIVFLGLISTFIGFRSATPADAAVNADWARLRVGQTAYLDGGAEDGDPGYTLVCHTLSQLIAFFHMDVNDCTPHRKMGTVVIVTAIQPGFDDSSKINGGISKDIAFVAIRAVKGSWTGWVQQIDLEPIIPVGTRIELKSVNDVPPSISRTASSSVDVSIGSPVMVELLRQAPPSENCNRYVRVLDDPKAGSTGWTCDGGTIPGTKLRSDSLN